MAKRSTLYRLFINAYIPFFSTIKNNRVFSEGIVAPAFNQKGGGIQYEFGFKIEELIIIGYLK